MKGLQRPWTDFVFWNTFLEITDNLNCQSIISGVFGLLNRSDWSINISFRFFGFAEMVFLNLLFFFTSAASFGLWTWRKQKMDARMQQSLKNLHSSSPHEMIIINFLLLFKGKQTIVAPLIIENTFIVFSLIKEIEKFGPTALKRKMWPRCF